MAYVHLIWPVSFQALPRKQMAFQRGHALVQPLRETVIGMHALPLTVTHAFVECELGHGRHTKPNSQAM
eukprot:1157236-Pelagomonas_calceolata.AAC.1